MTQLAGKRAVVTGASRGIGAAVADALAAEGADVVRVSRTARNAHGHVPCDLTDPASVDSSAVAIVAAGAPDLLINNAGSFLLRSFVETTEAEFVDQVNANLVGPARLLRALLPEMAESGHIITVGSVVDYQVFPGNAAYAAAKHGLRALHEVIALEYRGRVRSTLISPAATDTAAWDDVDPDNRDDLPNRSSMLTPQDVAAAVLFAATQPASVSIDVIRMSAA